MKPGVSARRAAVAMMNAALIDGQTLSQSGVAVLPELSPGERARAQRLSSEALRWANRSDRVLGPFLRLRPREQTLNILRLGVWEMLGDGQDPHGVIDTLVQLAKENDPTRGASGLVNAVLRNVIRKDVDWNALPLPELPRALRKQLVAQLGKERVKAIEAAHAKGAAIDLTLRDTSPEVPGSALLPTGSALLPTGSLRLSDSPMVSSLPGYAEGAFWVQDVAASIPVRLLTGVSGSRVLDMCAAPGGKTLQLAAAGSETVALEISEARAQRLRENLLRTGLSAELVVADALNYEPTQPFDLVLLDAPCSATGTIRRHPELPYLDPIARLAETVPLQERMLDRAISWLKPGGRLLYCTCSLLEQEGESQIRTAKIKHPDLKIVSLAGAASWVDPAWVSSEGFLRLTPEFWADLGGMDGFFIALLEIPS